jgi:hypothetical protein
MAGMISQRQVLEAIYTREAQFDWLSTARSITEDIPGADLKTVRMMIRVLKAESLIYREEAFNFETGLLCGSGYALTTEGEAKLQALRAGERDPDRLREDRDDQYTERAA